MRLIKSAILTVAISIGLASVPAQANDVAVSSVAKVNLPQYAGTWYEIARFPMFFQRHCARDVTASYSLNADGTINVDNRCVTSSGKQIGSVGQAHAVDASNSQLKVTFLPSWLRWLPVGQGDYWILKLDANYQTVLVGSPSRQYLWILSRQPQLDERTYLSYVESARKQGFDITQLQRTVQTPR